MKNLTVVLLVLLSMSCYSQQDPFIGVWKGTSLCQVKNSPCKNETVVYYISAGKAKNSYVMRANKIVNGQEEEMGDLQFTYTDSIKAIINKQVDRSNHQNIWLFKAQGKNMDGTLTSDGVLYRIIQAKKD